MTHQEQGTQPHRAGGNPVPRPLHPEPPGRTQERPRQAPGGREEANRARGRSTPPHHRALSPWLACVRKANASHRALKADRKPPSATREQVQYTAPSAHAGRDHAGGKRFGVWRSIPLKGIQTHGFAYVRKDVVPSRPPLALSRLARTHTGQLPHMRRASGVTGGRTVRTGAQPVRARKAHHRNPSKHAHATQRPSKDTSRHSAHHRAHRQQAAPGKTHAATAVE